MYFIKNGKRLTLGGSEGRGQFDVTGIIRRPQSLTFTGAPLPLILGPVVVLIVKEPSRPALDRGHCQQAQGDHVGGKTDTHLTVT